MFMTVSQAYVGHLQAAKWKDHPLASAMLFEQIPDMAYACPGSAGSFAGMRDMIAEVPSNKNFV